MRRWSRRVLMLLFVCLAAPAASQSPSAVAQPSGCTYRTCALRLEPVFLGVALVRGDSGERVSRVSGFGGGVDLLLAGPDSAVSYTRSYVRATKQSAVLGLLAAGAYTFVAVRTDNFRRSINAVDASDALGGAALMVGSIPLTNRAHRALSRAIWWYNAALPR